MNPLHLLPGGDRQIRSCPYALLTEEEIQLMRQHKFAKHEMRYTRRDSLTKWSLSHPSQLV
jgi:hypothetical protein